MGSIDDPIVSGYDNPDVTGLNAQSNKKMYGGWGRGGEDLQIPHFLLIIFCLFDVWLKQINLGDEHRIEDFWRCC